LLSRHVFKFCPYFMTKSKRTFFTRVLTLWDFNFLLFFFFFFF
jgi:hypothetical protein